MHCFDPAWLFPARTSAWVSPRSRPPISQPVENDSGDPKTHDGPSSLRRKKARHKPENSLAIADDAYACVAAGAGPVSDYVTRELMTFY